MDPFIETFWGEEGFDHLRKYVRNGYELFKEIIGVLEERVELEETYAKGLQKLSARLNKATKNAVGTVDVTWKFVASELENEAVVHRNLGNALDEEIVKPLKTVQSAHYKTRKTIDATVEKSIKQTASRRAALEKAKKTSHNLAADLEKVSQDLSQENRRVAKLLSEKQTIKLSAKRAKQEECSLSADRAYHEIAISAERQRQELEFVLAAAALRAETLEETRLANLQTALGRYYCHLSQLGPALTNACAQQFQTRIDRVSTVDVRQDLSMIISQCQPSQQPCRTLVLCDFYAEDFSNPMAAERRKEALLRYLASFERDLEQEKQGPDLDEYKAADHLSTLYDKSPLFSDVQAKLTLRHDFSDVLSLVEFLDFHVYKITCRLASLDSVPLAASNTHTHKLSKYENHCKDKMGLRQTLLRIPLPTDRRSASAQPRRKVMSYSMTVCEKRQPGDGQSPPRKQWDEEEDYPPYEHFDTESSADTFSSTSSSAKVETCQALYDFEPQRDDQLAIYEGDIIKITERTTDEWWLGELSGRSGFFPASYVKEL